MYRAIYAYAWDVAELTPDATVAKLSGLGLNTLTLACSYHAGKFIRPQGRTGKVFFPQDGTVYFKARPERYGVLEPRINGLIESDDILATYCERDSIDVNAWLVLFHNTPMGMLHPEATVRNAFGDPYCYSLCPANPDVRDYARALCADLTEAYGVSGVSLETPGYLPYTHGYHHEFAQVPQNPWLDTLLALCFCDHCVAGARRAGLEGAHLRSRIAASIERYFVSDVSAPQDMAKDWLLNDVIGDPELHAFLRWRCDVVTTLVEEIRSKVRKGATVAVIPSVQRPTSAAWLEGSNLSALAGAADMLEVPLYEPDTSRLLADLWDVRRRAGEGASLRAILRPGWPDKTSREQVIETVVAVVAAGISDIAFYNFGHLRAVNLQWIGDALAALEGE